MKRIFCFTIVCAFACAFAASAHAQSRRVWRAEPPPAEERTGKSETKDEAKNESEDEAKDEAKNESKEKRQDGAQAAGDDDPVSSKEVTQRAVIKSRPNPGYSHEARSYGVQGQVKLRIILGSEGKVRDKIEVLEGLPHGLTEEAIKAARRIKFTPARKDGRPVSQYVVVFYHFYLY